MFTIEEYSVEQLDDPFGLLPGDRYEFKLFLTVEVDDDLHTEKGVYIRVLFKVEDHVKKITQSSFHEQSTDRYLDFELEEDEEKMVFDFCEKNIPSTE
jgi:hypothetical protein